MGGMLSEPVTTKQIHTGTNDKLRWASCEMQGWRQYMEDSKIAQLDLEADKDVSLFAVFDGHGGCEVARYVANHFVTELAMRKSFIDKDYGRALKQTFIQLDMNLKFKKDAIAQQIRHKSQGEKTQNVTEDMLSAGCTANVVLITPTKIYIANAGDSRSALMKSSGSVCLSEDHKPSLKREEDRIIKSGGKIIDGRVNGNLNLTRAIGDFREKAVPGIPYNQQPITCQPEINEVDRDGTQQFLIVACDGIWEREYQKDVDPLLKKFKASLSESVPATKVLENFFDENISRETMVPYGKDNMTAILVQFLK